MVASACMRQLNMSRGEQFSDTYYRSSASRLAYGMVQLGFVMET